MIRSMTGFGKAEYTEDGVCVTVEVSSVNGRFFDMKTKMPKSLSEYESKLRTIVQEYIERGRVTVSVYIDQPGLSADELNVDFDVIRKYMSIADDVSSTFDVENTVDIQTLLMLPEVITIEENGFDVSGMWEKVKKAVVPALDAHRNMRECEGAAIGKDIGDRLGRIQDSVAEIIRLAPASVEANTTRLRSKIEGFLGGGAVDETRFAMEVALYADRADITEECVRLKSHCEQYARELSGEKTSGRKLSFLLQEMNREANTISSKAMDAAISQTVVGIKEELEKMREQAENME